ncbi:molybdenum cofactor biosynthesis protein MoeB [Parvularcula bermudensis HTCC2503]|uniref:Molybdenum cofactor biosynthesis protein MoeB n=1 Tax=Parvularcula bermudensis (strain ATCC BAA-594 / HTCC2503 / KCTC 12087) TaxID=314260 RepID=E0TF70_PARBH|nr:HesA/MoeB/ThiF family protein [Parvularcula bermudensis]ADM08988.1 molybdenum cofactor biosynthesis protein MoeB [Parvularcula bermudensis HTCC2503]
MSFSAEERERYKRHLLLPEIGGQGQQKLKAARVTMVGVGGLGCPILAYLAAAGVGTLRLIDGDHVELSNLQRQILFEIGDLGQLKVDAAARRLRALNPEISIEPHPIMLTEATADRLLSQSDLIIEGLDRFAPRYLVNRAARRARIPLLSAALGRFDGQILSLRSAPEGPCYRCLVPRPPEDEALCETQGVLGVTAGVVGTLTALEAIKHLLSLRGELIDELLILDTLGGVTRRARLRADPACPDCGAPAIS